MVLDHGGYVQELQGSGPLSAEAQGCVIGSRIVAVCAVQLMILLSEKYMPFAETQAQHDVQLANGTGGWRCRPE